MSNLPTKQDLLDKATKCKIVNKEVAKTIERKTMTRRVCKIQPRADACDELYADEYNHNNQNWAYWCRDGRLHEYLEKPQYKVGDIGWIREPAMINSFEVSEQEYDISYANDDFKKTHKFKMPRKHRGKKWTKKRGIVPNGCLREMARYFFEITAVRVERLQDISKLDIRNEGFDEMTNYNSKSWFINLWNSTAKKSINDWDSNPYVFVYEFKLLKYKG